MIDLCNLQVDIMVQKNGKLDVYINNEGDSGCHYTNMTADDIGKLVADEIDVRYDGLIKSGVLEPDQIPDVKPIFSPSS